ncbi:hypothetical protein K9L97_03660 [Candidatus Woesearchaeota archaeon]|nr:hypothetical protein [Candidatus Woesearchaeota archaeon]
MIVRYYFGIIFLLLLIPSVLSLGVTPPIIRAYYEPSTGLSGEYSVSIRSYSSQETSFEVIMNGELAKYVIIEDEKITVPPKGLTAINFLIDIPSFADYVGPHEVQIGAREFIPENQGLIAVRTAVKSRFIVDFPYQGEYLEIKGFSIENVNKNQDTTMNINILSRGLDVTNYETEVKILDNNYEKIYEKTWPKKRIGPKQTDEIQETISTKTWIPGKYYANLKVKYSDMIREKNITFRIGEESIILLDYDPKNVTEGELLNLRMEFENLWKGRFENVYAEINLEGVNARSPSFTIEELGKINITQFVDTKNLENGTYDGEIEIFFLNKSEKHPIIIEVLNPYIPKKINYTLVLLTIAIIILILVILLLTLKTTKKKHKHKHRK